MIAMSEAAMPLDAYAWETLARVPWPMPPCRCGRRSWSRPLWGKCLRSIGGAVLRTR